MASTALRVRERIVAASKRIGRVKRIDRAASALVTFGGIFIIIGVLFIFLFIAAETLPLFRSATAEELLTLSLGAGASPQEGSAALGIGIDEYQKYVYQILPDAKVAFYRADNGALHREIPIAGLDGARLTAASRSLQGDFFAAGTDDGRVALLQVRFRPVFEGQVLDDLEIEVRDRGLLTVDVAARPVKDVSYWESPEGEKSLAALVGDSDIVLVRFGDDGSPVLETLPPRAGERVTHVRLGRNAELVAATGTGRLHHWDIGGGEVHLTETIKVSDVDITALEYGLGGNTIIVGDGNGALSAWFRARPNPDAPLELVKAHEFESQGAPIVSIGSSTRERSFVTGSADGSIFLRHLTSERTLLRFKGFEGRGDAAAVDAALITPRADGILVRRNDGTLDRYSLANPHPEFSWRAVWGKVWYEGYSEPEYVWQST
ncbi:MAG TPA: hypothetical protein VJH87_11800, partial [Vicinamibacteria bacterium]|nr:hypothetical protein [Vicinamibacteria bacterium]